MLGRTIAASIAALALVAPAVPAAAATPASSSGIASNRTALNLRAGPNMEQAGELKGRPLIIPFALAAVVAAAVLIATSGHGHHRPPVSP